MYQYPECLWRKVMSHTLIQPKRWVSSSALSVYLILSLLIPQLWNRLQPLTPILNAEFHASGPNQGELGTWDLCRQGLCSSVHFTGSKPSKISENHQMLWQLNTLFSSHWVSAEQAPGDVNKKKRGNFWVTLFWCKNPNQKKMVRNWFLFASWKPWSPQIPWE